LNLKRGAKALTVDAVASPLGSSPLAAKALLSLLKLEYGPVPRQGGGAPGRACISVDFDVTVPSRFDDNRAGTLALVELAARYRIPITWAVCGKSAEKDMRSYSAIADPTGENEIGVHTYSHLDATVSTAEEFRTDIVRCIQSLGLDSPSTFVFPWNREAHFDVIRGLGFRVFRGKSRAIGNPVLKEGVWNVRPVYYVDQKSEGAESLMMKYLDLCIDLSVPFHLWTHPWALVKGGDVRPMMGTLESLFTHMSKRRDAGDLIVTTLGSLSATLDGQESVAQVPSGELTHTPGIAN
jgi:peptidoglycan/xylan/chitin deacetylase (PgdA/CDA1 family)